MRNAHSIFISRSTFHGTDCVERNCLAAQGIGITPFVAILTALQSALPSSPHAAALAESGPKEIVLLHTDSTLASIPFREKLEALAASCVEWSDGAISVRIEWVLTGADENKRLNEQRVAEAVPDVSEFEVMLCGPAAFQEDMYGALGALGVGMERISTESFLA